MKYAVVLGDGMADYPIPELDNKTPLQYAYKPNMDFLAKYGEIGMVKTIPDGLPPGSDVANLSVMGYDPVRYYTGRSSLEAVSMGIDLSPDDVSFRCNLVTLSDEVEYADKTMVDYSSDEISSEEAAQLIKELNLLLKSSKVEFYPGVSYRHCLVLRGDNSKYDLTPPHDILEKKITEYLPKGDNSKMLLEMMVKSYDILKNHPVNKARIAKGLRPANSIWLWGNGRKPSLTSFYEKYGIKGSVISAVDLVKGIGICAGLKSCDVEGATGNINTNFTGKAEAALKEFESGQDFVFIHVEAPDECGHRHEIENKVKSIELIDEKIVGPLLQGLDKYDDYRILLLPDHPTPLSLRTHTGEPVPYVLYQKSKRKDSGVESFDEYEARSSGIMINEGYLMMDKLLK
ncbi:MAG TPA: cofactor-independent phosphoglycerate mutase [Clostridiaceae bacterium]|nr:cofactor-independent phosphoglycerate mutase [Clostridiaceae bacterium]